LRGRKIGKLPEEQAAADNCKTISKKQLLTAIAIGGGGGGIVDRRRASGAQPVQRIQVDCKTGIMNNGLYLRMNERGEEEEEEEEVMMIVYIMFMMAIPLEGPIDVYHPKNNMDKPKHKYNDSCIKDTEKATKKCNGRGGQINATVGADK
jgi:hypothetical protein